MRGCGEHTVHIPLVGIEMQVDSLRIGSVVLRKMAGGQLEELERQIELSMRQSEAASEEVERQLMGRLSQILDSFRETVMAEVRVVARPEQFKSEAEALVRRVLDLLRYSIPRVYPNHLDLDLAIGIRGDILPVARANIALATSGDGATLTWQWQAAETRVPFVISQQSLDQMATLGIFEVATILEKPEREWTDFESTLLDGIHWFGNAQMEFEVAYRLLSLITCLETFLTPQDGNPIGAALAEGVAITIGDTLEERKRLKKEVHKLYSMRSAVTHGGRKNVPEERVASLTGMAEAFIVEMIGRREQFPGRDELLEWILDQKLSPAGKPA